MWCKQTIRLRCWLLVVGWVGLVCAGQSAKMFAEEYLNRVPLSNRRQQELNTVASNAERFGQVSPPPSSGGHGRGHAGSALSSSSPSSSSSSSSSSAAAGSALFAGSFSHAAVQEVAFGSTGVDYLYQYYAEPFHIVLPEWLSLVDPASRHIYWENQLSFETQWENP